MISELAAHLVDGTPCPVCGALDHPDPSEVRAGRVTYEQEEVATREAERAGEDAAEIGRALAGTSAVAGELVARLARAGYSVPGPTAHGAAGPPETVSRMLVVRLFSARPVPTLIRRCSIRRCSIRGVLDAMARALERRDRRA